MDLDDEFVGQVMLPLKLIWLKTRVQQNGTMEALNGLTKPDLVALCIDEMISKHTYEIATRTIHRAVDMYGMRTVSSFLAANLDIE